MKSDDEECEEAEHSPPMWDADENVPDGWDKMFNESSDSDFEGFQFSCMTTFHKIYKKLILYYFNRPELGM